MADMTDVVFWRGGTQDLEVQPIIDGQLLYDTDTGKIYMDNGSERKELSKQEAVTLKPLNFTGAVTETYDGTAEKTINIPQGGSGGGDIFNVVFTQKGSSPYSGFEADKTFSEIHAALRAKKTVIGLWIKKNDWTGGDQVNTYIVNAYGSQQIEFTDTTIHGENGDYIQQAKFTMDVNSSVTKTERKIDIENGLVLYASGAPDAEVKTVVYHSGNNQQELRQGRIVSIVMQEANTASAVKMNFQGDTYELYASLYDRTIPEIAKGVTLLCQVQEGAFVWLNRDLTSGGSGGVQPDWNQNDETAPDYIKNRICYSKDPVESVWLEETNVVDGQIEVSPWSKEVKPFTKYKVNIDGVESVIESSYNQVDVSGWAIGTFEKLPFFMPINMGQGLILMGILASSAKKVSIKEIYEESVKLPEKYLPKKLLNTVGETTFQGGEIFNSYITLEGVVVRNEAGNYSHAEGEGTVASGDVSHAEGSETTASAFCSHAENIRTIAAGLNSHAEGNETIASGKDQHVQGIYNIPDTSDGAEQGIPNNKYAHIVGNGTADDARSNAHTLDWQGNSWYQGNVLIGGKDMDAPMGVFAPDHIIIKASDSEDRFKITVDKTGAIKAEKVV